MACRLYVELVNLHAALKWYRTAHCYDLPDCIDRCRPPADPVWRQPCSRPGRLCPASHPPPRQPQGIRTWPTPPGTWRFPSPHRCAPVRSALNRVAQRARHPVAASLLLSGFFMFAVLLAMGIIPLPTWQWAGVKLAIRSGRPVQAEYVAVLSGTQQCVGDKLLGRLSGPALCWPATGTVGWCGQYYPPWWCRGADPRTYQLHRGTIWSGVLGAWLPDCQSPAGRDRLHRDNAECRGRRSGRRIWCPRRFRQPGRSPRVRRRGGSRTCGSQRADWAETAAAGRLGRAIRHGPGHRRSILRR